MNLMRESRGWLLPYVVDNVPPSEPVAQILEYLLYPSGPDDSCVIVLCDREYYITVKLTALALAAQTERDLSATQMRGAIVQLRKFEKVISPSRVEVQLVCDHFEHLGADGASPFFTVKDLNQVPAVRAALEKESEAVDDMLLMAEVVDQDHPQRTPYQQFFPFSMQETIIPDAQRRTLKSFPGWTTMGDDVLTPSSQQQDYFQEGVGTQASWAPSQGLSPKGSPSKSSPYKNSPNDGFVNFVDGVELKRQKIAAEDVEAVVSLMVDDPPYHEQEQVEQVEQDQNHEKDSSPLPVPPPLSPGIRTPSLSLDKDTYTNSSVSPVAVAVVGAPAVAVHSMSLSFGMDEDHAPPPLQPLQVQSGSPKGPGQNQSQSLSVHGSPVSSPMVGAAPSPTGGVDDASDGGAQVDLSEEELPLFRARSLPEEVVGVSSSVVDSSASVAGLGGVVVPVAETGGDRWTQNEISLLCKSIGENGKDWQLAADLIGSHCTPARCEKFFLQYFTFLPDLKAALDSFLDKNPVNGRESSKKRRTSKVNYAENNDGDRDEFDDDEDEEQSDVYDVEGILDEREVGGGVVEFLVKWKGYSDAEASWIRHESFVDCADVMAKWENHKAEMLKEKAPPPPPSQPSLPVPSFQRSPVVERVVTPSPAIDSAAKKRWRPRFVLDDAVVRAKIDEKESFEKRRRHSMTNESLSSRIAAKRLLEP